MVPIESSNLLMLVNNIIYEVNKILDPNTRVIKKPDNTYHVYTDEILTHSTITSNESLSFRDSVIITSKNS